MNERKTARQSNLELLRILAMCMIICCHFVTYNNFGPTDVLSDKMLALSMLRLGGKLGVVLFVMITGYFLLDKPFRWRRIISLSRQTIYFSVVVAILAFLFEETKPDLLGVLKIMFPLVMENYWFPTDFAIILLLSPALNLLVHNINRRNLLFGVLGSITLIGFPIIVPDVKNSVIGLVLAYILGAFIQKYRLNFSNIKLLAVLVLVVVATVVITGLLITESRSSEFIAGFRLFFVTGFNVSAYSAAFLIFMIFKQWEFGNIKIINLIASTTFGVYLFHDSRAFRLYMWHEIIDPTRWTGLSLVVGLSLTVISVFAVGMVLDILRQMLFLMVSNITRKLKSKKMSFSEMGTTNF